MRETRSAPRCLALAFAILTLATGCDIETLRIQVCPGGLAVQVSTEPDAEFTWNGGCGIGGLEVREFGASQAVLWRIRDRQGANRLIGPIRYGTAPPEATVLIPPAPLEPETRYVVEVTTLSSIQGREIRSVAGGATFTW